MKLEDLKVGMYVLIDEERIELINKIDVSKGVAIFNTESKEKIILGKNIPIYASFKIIDLVEVGDIVNGKLVVKLIPEYLNGVKQVLLDDNSWLVNSTIKTIIKKKDLDRNVFNV